MKKRTAMALATATAVGTAGLSLAPPASADLTTRCVGEGGAVTVPGDLVVPRNRSCVLSGTTVEGDVRVARGADLVAENVTVGGRLIGAPDAYVETFSSTLEGRVLLRGAYGSYLDSTDISGRVLTRPGGDSDVGGFVYTFETDIAEDLVSRSGELFVEASEIHGDVTSRHSVYTDVYESFVDGRMLVRDNARGSVVCSTAVAGAAEFLNNADLVQLGSDGPVADCAGSSYWGDDVTVNGTSGSVYVDQNIVNGDLTLRSNEPVALVGSHNMVRGSIIGEYDAWDGSEPMTTQRRTAKRQTTKSKQSGQSAQSAQERREDVLDNKVERRRSSAVQSADRAGSAQLGR